eukprot:15462657-Alexandrium_andersonii.AAC.1
MRSTSRAGNRKDVALNHAMQRLTSHAEANIHCRGQHPLQRTRHTAEATSPSRGQHEDPMQRPPDTPGQGSKPPEYFCAKQTNA